MDDTGGDRRRGRHGVSSSVFCGAPTDSKQGHGSASRASPLAAHPDRRLAGMLTTRTSPLIRPGWLSHRCAYGRETIDAVVLQVDVVDHEAAADHVTAAALCDAEAGLLLNGSRVAPSCAPGRNSSRPAERRRPVVAKRGRSQTNTHLVAVAGCSERHDCRRVVPKPAAADEVSGFADMREEHRRVGQTSAPLAARFDADAVISTRRSLATTRVAIVKSVFAAAGMVTTGSALAASSLTWATRSCQGRCQACQQPGALERPARHDGAVGSRARDCQQHGNQRHR